jgi:ribosomal-protein-alanine N-acetyltransferase
VVWKRVEIVYSHQPKELMLDDSFVIETTRCRLRKFSRRDISFIFSASRYAGFCDGMMWSPPDAEEDLLETHEASEVAWASGRAFTFTIEKLISTEPIGRIVIRREEEDEPWTVGFWIHPVHQRQGYMTEALRAIVDFGFEHLSAAEIQAEHATWNIGSRRALEKAGFQHIRHIPRGFEKNGRWVAVDLLRITAEHWHTE